MEPVGVLAVCSGGVSLESSTRRRILRALCFCPLEAQRAPQQSRSSHPTPLCLLGTIASCS